MHKKQLIISVIACVIIAIFVSPFLSPVTGVKENTETALPVEPAAENSEATSTEEKDSAAYSAQPDIMTADTGTAMLLSAGATASDTEEDNAANAAANKSTVTGYNYSFGFTRSMGADLEKEEEPAGTTVILEETGFGENVVLSLLSDADNLTSYISARAGAEDEPAAAEAPELKEDLVSRKLAEIPLPSDVPSSLTYVYNRKFKMNVSDYERNVLYRIVQAEAGDQDIYGRILVANVVLNRVLDSSYPNDIEGVVFQKIGGSTQFAPTKDGRYYTVTVTSKTINAVDRALRGEDYSNGALYFFQRNLTTSDKAAWFDTTLKRLFKYGDHEFYTDKRK